MPKKAASPKRGGAKKATGTKKVKAKKGTGPKRPTSGNNLNSFLKKIFCIVFVFPQRLCITQLSVENK